MENKVKNYRSILIINGIIALIFGLFALFATEALLITFAKYFGLVLAIGGGIGVFAAFSNKKNNKDYLFSMISSILSVLIGLFILIFTHTSLEIFIIIIGIWAIFVAVSQLWISFKITGANNQKKILLFNGLLTLAFGVILFLKPVQSIVTLFSIVGILAVVFGVVLIYLSIILHPTK